MPSPLRVKKDEKAKDIQEQHDSWKNQVLKDHYETKTSSENLLRSIKNTQTQGKRTLREVQQIIGVWDKFEQDMKQACKELGERYETDLIMKNIKNKEEPGCSCCNHTLRQKLRRAAKKSIAISAILKYHRFR
ncbi:unnamed protein product [Moneuplotes crassus]|uniref:Uncharacterized protein n=1 Tax=Euplotes crassus TaxID=5936 RepID=A0AAD1XQG9_EUPCR|nr:unnamed protein product [Moneuplotes crassus]